MLYRIEIRWCLQNFTYVNVYLLQFKGVRAKSYRD
jgi:hypothetical protein